jgi:hypothetical protein
MKKNLLLLLAFDALLLELDEDYQGISDTEQTIIGGKVLEEYGLKVGDTTQDHTEVRQQMIKEIYEFRDEVIKEIRS